MKELVLFLAKQLVNHPDAVEVKETQGDTASVLELKVARGGHRARDRQAGTHRQVDSDDPRMPSRPARTGRSSSKSSKTK